MKKHIFTLGATALVSIGIADAASADTDTHKVKAGETLFSISQQHNVTVEDLKKWNGLSSTLIYANQTLQIDLHLLTLHLVQLQLQHLQIIHIQ
ncbi:LysM peptidoglycan-binding domain-containing protein [Priestia sp. OVS21]|nr:LysM peptidoglycan-binding domain-containing protein [Priestia sp. OVS21]